VNIDDDKVSSFRILRALEKLDVSVDAEILDVYTDVVKHLCDEIIEYARDQESSGQPLLGVEVIAVTVMKSFGVGYQAAQQELKNSKLIKRHFELAVKRQKLYEQHEN